MIMRKTLLAVFLLFMLSCKSEDKQLDNVFYAFNNCVRTLPNAPDGFKAQANLVKDLGYDGLAGHVEDNYFELRAAMDEVGLEMPEMYIGMYVVEGRVEYHEKLKEILTDSKDRDLLVALHFHADGLARPDADSLFAEGIADLAEFAAPLNIKLAIYPHVDFYCEEMSHALDLVKRIK
jgi:sugar phosphate isomerase/epimerase